MILSGVHVLLVSLFGRPIVRSISHFFGRPIFFLVDQKPISHFFGRPIFFWLSKKKLVDQKHKKMAFSWPKKYWLTKKMKNLKLTGQLVDQRDWPKVHGRRYCETLLISLCIWMKALCWFLKSKFKLKFSAFLILHSN